jgi:hypothetical protein
MKDADILLTATRSSKAFFDSAYSQAMGKQHPTLPTNVQAVPANLLIANHVRKGRLMPILICHGGVPCPPNMSPTCLSHACRLA